MALTQISTAGVKDDAVTSGKIPADAVGSSEIAANAVGSSELADNAVDTAAIADNAITSAKIANGAVDTAQINNDAITTQQIADSTITAGDLADDAVTAAKLASDAVVTASIVDDAITSAKIAANAITANELADSAVDTNAIQDSAITGGKLATSSVSINKMANNSVGTAEIVDEAVTLAKLPHGTSSNDGKFLRANNGADPTFETVSGTTINNNAATRVITGSGTSNTLEGNSDLLWDGSRLDIDTGGTADALRIGNSAGADTFIRLGSIGTATDTHAVLKYDKGSNYLSMLVSGESHGSDGIVIANGGNVGIGTATPAEKLTVDGGDISLVAAGAERLNIAHSGGGDVTFNQPTAASTLFKNQGNTRIDLSHDGTTTLKYSSNQYFRLLSSGDVSVVRTSANSGNAGMIVFHDGNDDFCGQITSNGANNTTSFVTNSDYRLKTNEALITDGITRIKNLKPYQFEWKSDLGIKVDGFFAHEAQAVVPESVVGTKDEVDSDNNPVYQGIDQAKIVPLLTAALQEAITKIETLETKVAALEAA